MIFAYNKEQVGDVLMVILEDTKDIKRSVERRGHIARITADETGKTLAWNIFDVSQLLTIEGNGQVFPSQEDLDLLNQELAKEGFEEKLTGTAFPVFVVGQITEMVAHPDSDHLNICQVAIGADKTVQIVAGAPNAALDLKTIVALPGAMMPSGSLIFPGKLRGQDSYGMMCSPRELALPNAPQKRGIIELADSAVVGEAFDTEKHWQA
ncbi:YtpR family tRNA-binding protein [Streptococcus hongkongensis]|nr:tRNA-binding protein [Streptococcus uberis]